MIKLALVNGIVFSFFFFFVFISNIHFLFFWNLVDDIDESIRSVFTEQLKTLTKGLSPDELNAEYGKNNSSVLSLVAVARADLLIHPDKKGELKDKICVVDKQATRQDLETILSIVSRTYGPEEVSAFQEAASKQFPLASAFKKTEESSTIN